MDSSPTDKPVRNIVTRFRRNRINPPLVPTHTFPSLSIVTHRTSQGNTPSRAVNPLHCPARQRYNPRNVPTHKAPSSSVTVAVTSEATVSGGTQLVIATGANGDACPVNSTNLTPSNRRQ